MKLILTGASSHHVIKQGEKIKVIFNERPQGPDRSEEGLCLTADGTGILLLKVSLTNLYCEENSEIFIPWTSISEIYPKPKPIGVCVKEVENLCKKIKGALIEYRSWQRKFEDKTKTPEFENLKVANTLSGEAKPYQEILQEKEKEIYKLVVEQRNIVSGNLRRNMSVGDRARILLLLEPQLQLVAGLEKSSFVNDLVIKALIEENSKINYPPWYYPEGKIEYTEAELREMDDVEF